MNEEEAQELLRLELGSKEVYALMETANRISRLQSKGKGESHYHIGVNAEPCPFNCLFCSLAEKAILDEYAPAGVLISDKYEILHFVGKTDRYLAPPTGKPGFHILNMARENLKHPLTTALHKAVRENSGCMVDRYCFIG